MCVRSSICREIIIDPCYHRRVGCSVICWYTCCTFRKVCAASCTNIIDIAVLAIYGRSRRRDRIISVTTLGIRVVATIACTVMSSTNEGMWQNRRNRNSCRSLSPPAARGSNCRCRCGCNRWILNGTRHTSSSIKAKGIASIHWRKEPSGSSTR